MGREMNTTKIVRAAGDRLALPAPSERRRIRELARVSQHEVGEALGVSDAAISRYETGQREPRGTRVGAYRRLLESLRVLAEAKRDA